MSESEKYEFKKREIALILILFLMCGAILFYMGIKIGQLLLHKNTIVAEEMIKAANSPVENCNNNKPQKQEEACKAPIAINFAVENPPTKDTKGKYTVQIDAYQDKDDAEKRTLELYNSGYKLVYYTKVEIPEKGTWFRVGIGFFKLRSDAEKFGEMLKSKDEVTNYIVRKVD